VWSGSGGGPRPSSNRLFRPRPVCVPGSCSIHCFVSLLGCSRRFVDFLYFYILVQNRCPDYGARTGRGGGGVIEMAGDITEAPPGGALLKKTVSAREEPVVGSLESGPNIAPPCSRRENSGPGIVSGARFALSRLRNRRRTKNGWADHRGGQFRQNPASVATVEKTFFIERSCPREQRSVGGFVCLFSSRSGARSRCFGIDFAPAATEKPPLGAIDNP